MHIFKYVNVFYADATQAVEDEVTGGVKKAEDKEGTKERKTWLCFIICIIEIV